MELNDDARVIGDCGIILQQVEGERLYEIGYHFAATSGDRVSRPKPPLPAATGPSRT